MSYELIQGDCIESMRQLPAGSVQTCVTSPPYYGLRDYGHEGQIGLEETPEAYVAKLVDVFWEVRRVLRDDGTLWLNLGDSYWGGKGQSGYELPHEAEERRGRGQTMQHGHNVPGYTKMRPTDGKHPVIKPKDLIGIPWMVAFALRADGWYLRSDIIWHKPNPMPESVTDRPTKAHEYLFLLSKSASYFYDNEAIAEGRVAQHDKYQFGGGKHVDDGTNRGDQFAALPRVPSTNRNRRSVWTVATAPYSGAHFATFPPALIEPCILAGTSAHGCCARCGAPWARVVEEERTNYKASNYAVTAANGAISGGVGKNFPDTKRTTIGWQPTCTCNADVVPCTVLDPFNGSGTTGAVALKHHRHYIGCELNPDYIALAHERIRNSQPLLLDVIP